MTPSQAERNRIDELAEEFAERYRRGERPPCLQKRLSAAAIIPRVVSSRAPGSGTGCRLAGDAAGESLPESGAP